MSSNRLAQSDSPYLRMHADNPVDWYPWGDEAFEKAKREGKPVFISIGYSSCYWCRVAEETLYRDPAIAARMNAGFVNVKVDREQRPDLDRLYQAATRLLGGPGGWPNNLFLTPERKPFFAGSYFPPADDDLGRPGFPTVMSRILDVWAKRRGELIALSDRVAQALKSQPPQDGAAIEPARWKREAVASLLALADAERGGLKSGGAAKFPQAPELTLLAGDARGKAVVKKALDAMAAGGLRDHLAGGFHRYTVDPGWATPHFEKMLYDNAQLLKLYATAGRNEIARETAGFLLREMQAPEGGFYASFDAVSEGREGAHYLWDEREIRAVLGRSADRFLAAYRVVPLPGHLDDPAEEFDRGACGSLCERGGLRLREGARTTKALGPARGKLLARRALRPAPARDDKIILSWNGLAIEALAVAGERLAEPRFSDAARKAADRLWRDAWEAGRLRQAIFEGRSQGEGFLEDYANFGLGLLALGQRERAAALADAMLVRLGRADGGLNETALGTELFAAMPEMGDGPYPAGASSAWRLLAQLETTEPRFRTPAERLLAALASLIARAPDRWPSLLAVLPDGVSAGDASPGSAGVVSLSSRRQGNRLAVTLSIAPGWHVNANPASDADLIPTRIEFEGGPPAAIRYSKPERFRAAFARGEIAVYSGKTVIEADFSGDKPAAARLTVQACSDETCLPPATLPVPLR
ncbi:MAG: DUF255 domain-containing protein [Candidatus Nitricoxidivorans perseverans]|uniref:DUF255 domain-containing protein n=1 Tax=Candidatus Nitricoxidivorans perseverans TaxID=2975601 RepID=A0AA49FLR3_9PROT|nr:MAG: DUF255 domain-containing protein [Candidatus Nitricoxidivorans perseverans]